MSKYIFNPRAAGTLTMAIAIVLLLLPVCGDARASNCPSLESNLEQAEHLIGITLGDLASAVNDMKDVCSGKNKRSSATASDSKGGAEDDLLLPNGVEISDEGNIEYYHYDHDDYGRVVSAREVKFSCDEDFIDGEGNAVDDDNIYNTGGKGGRLGDDDLPFYVIDWDAYWARQRENERQDRQKMCASAVSNLRYPDNKVRQALALKASVHRLPCDMYIEVDVLLSTSSDRVYISYERRTKHGYLDSGLAEVKGDEWRDGMYGHDPRSKLGPHAQEAEDMREKMDEEMQEFYATLGENMEKQDSQIAPFWEKFDSSPYKDSHPSVTEDVSEGDGAYEQSSSEPINRSPIDVDGDSRADAYHSVESDGSRVITIDADKDGVYDTRVKVTADDQVESYEAIDGLGPFGESSTQENLENDEYGSGGFVDMESKDSQSNHSSDLIGPENSSEAEDFEIEVRPAEEHSADVANTIVDAEELASGLGQATQVADGVVPEGILPGAVVDLVQLAGNGLEVLDTASDVVVAIQNPAEIGRMAEAAVQGVDLATNGRLIPNPAVSGLSEEFPSMVGGAYTDGVYGNLTELMEDPGHYNAREGYKRAMRPVTKGIAGIGKLGWVGNYASDYRREGHLPYSELVNTHGPWDGAWRYVQYWIWADGPWAQ